MTLRRSPTLALAAAVEAARASGEPAYSLSTPTFRERVASLNLEAASTLLSPPQGVRTGRIHPGGEVGEIAGVARELDEPLGALDASLRGRILPYLERVRDELGIPMLYVSHSAEEVRRVAERVIVLDQGRARLAGVPADVLSAASGGC